MCLVVHAQGLPRKSEHGKADEQGEGRGDGAGAVEGAEGDPERVREPSPPQLPLRSRRFWARGPGEAPTPQDSRLRRGNISRHQEETAGRNH